MGPLCVTGNLCDDTIITTVNIGTSISGSNDTHGYLFPNPCFFHCHLQALLCAHHSTAACGKWIMVDLIFPSLSRDHNIRTCGNHRRSLPHNKLPDSIFSLISSLIPFDGSISSEPSNVSAKPVPGKKLSCTLACKICPDLQEAEPLYLLILCIFKTIIITELDSMIK